MNPSRPMAKLSRTLGIPKSPPRSTTPGRRRTVPRRLARLTFVLPREPQRAEIPVICDEQLVVEFYSRWMFLDGITIELIPHCESTSPRGWTGDHDLRPLTETGAAQARALVPALRTDAGNTIAAIYSSPALRCTQTVQPLADVAALPIVEMPELLETRGFAGPREWTEGFFQPIAPSLGGAWAAGKALRTLAFIARTHPGQRVVACSHGDVIPALLATLSATYDCALPPIVGRGGWYTLLFEGGYLVCSGRPAP